MSYVWVFNIYAFVCGYFTRCHLTICCGVSLMECLLYLPSCGFMHWEGQKCLLVQAFFGNRPSLLSWVSVLQSLGAGTQVPEIACTPLFNGMWTNLCCVLLPLVRAAIDWELTSEWKCLIGWEISVSFPTPEKEDVVFADHSDIHGPLPRGWQFSYGILLYTLQSFEGPREVCLF